jgi:hypothetical protein
MIARAALSVGTGVAHGMSAVQPVLAVVKSQFDTMVKYSHHFDGLIIR